MEREAIFWTSTSAGYNTRDREKSRMEGGRKVVEKVPQRGHQGDYESRRPARGVRYITVVRHEGHRVSLVLTSAAAHLDHNTPQGQYQLAKAKHHGWYQIGQCPCALLVTGGMLPEHFVDKKVAKDKPCEHGVYSGAKPCRHASRATPQSDR